MCTETFLRLPEEKRNRFLDAAWEEFTTVPFVNASINQIVRRAGIPRGSFYQYFTDKSDLFSYLAETARRDMTTLFHGLLSEAKGDIFRTTLLFFDRFLERWRSDSFPALDRLVRVTHLNSGMDLENLLTGKPEDYISGEFMREMDLSRFLRQDEEYVIQVCCLTAMCLGSALMDCLKEPKEGRRSRTHLIEKLEIVRGGCLCPEALREGGVLE